MLNAGRVNTYASARARLIPCLSLCRRDALCAAVPFGVPLGGTTQGQAYPPRISRTCACPSSSYAALLARGARRAPATCVSTKCSDGSRWKRGSASNTRGSACSALPRCSSCVWSRQCVHAGESARSAVTARSSPVAARQARSITAP